MCVLVASSRENMNASRLCLQGGFPVVHSKDNSHFLNMFGILWDNRELGKQGTSCSALCISGFIHRI